MLIGLVFGAFSYWLVTTEHFNALVLIPSIVSLTFGVTHLTKWEAPRE